MSGRWRRWLLSVVNLGVRARFAAGRASFVEADVEMTTNSVAEVYEEAGRPTGQRLLAHYRLSTKGPVGGKKGWSLLADRLLAPAAHRTVSLLCGYCGHLYVVQILSALDPLRPDAAMGRALARPASFSSDWFRFMHEDFEGKPSLSCPRCEQTVEPEVDHWEAAA